MHNLLRRFQLTNQGTFVKCLCFETDVSFEAKLWPFILLGLHSYLVGPRGDLSDLSSDSEQGG